jgi:hypothetical protein
LTFVVSHPSSKKPLDGWGTQFHPPWVGEAGGRLIQGKAALARNLPAYPRPVKPCKICHDISAAFARTIPFAGTRSMFILALFDYQLSVEACC